MSGLPRREGWPIFIDPSVVRLKKEGPGEHSLGGRYGDVSNAPDTKAVPTIEFFSLPTWFPLLISLIVKLILTADSFSLPN
jgi:hypothetical protein